MNALVADSGRSGSAEKAPKPFLKWVGGKRQLLPELLKHISVKFGRYYEPFVGGGALFFAVRPARATIGDANDLLMRTYAGVGMNVEGVISRLEGIEREHSSEMYSRVRAITPTLGTRDVDVAAWMIYLNHTCFNGLWRVNKAGKFNVPMGRYDNPTICDAPGLRAASEALCNVKLSFGDFEATVRDAKRGDFVYFDPPYIPASASANFVGYTKSGFGPVEQERLRDCALRLKARGVTVLLSNADVEEARKLYRRGFTIHRVEARRAVNSKASARGKVGELLIW